MRIPNDARTEDRTKTTIGIYSPLWKQFAAWCDVRGKNFNRVLETGIQILMAMSPDQMERACVALYEESPIEVLIRRPDEGVDPAEAARIVEQGLVAQKQAAVRVSATAGRHRKPA